MESYTIKNLTFSYPNSEKKALDNLSFSVKKGEFITICGFSGCGKTTLLRQLKSVLVPHGTEEGEVFFENKLLSQVNFATQSAKIGFVTQSPDNQIVTDKVWHELAFGLENLGHSTPSIRLKVAEMASFFGIHNWFYKSTHELSGGQKQLLNLASVMVMQPSVIILDEPTAQLDPIAASEFLRAVNKINTELGVTVIITEHRLEEVFSMSDRVLVMDNGKIVCDGAPKSVGETLLKMGHGMVEAMPAPMKVYGKVKNNLECPVTIKEGRVWLDEFSKTNPLGSVPDKKTKNSLISEPVIELDEVWFRYEKNQPDVIKGLSMKVYPGSFYAILGGNGTGKSTTLSIISGINTPYRGTVKILGKSFNKIENEDFESVIGVLPQNPQSVFVENTLESDFREMLLEKKIRSEDQNVQIEKIAKLCKLDNLLCSHPYDLSGGEMQRAALAKVLLLSPKILILDEPTKGFDGKFKKVFAQILDKLLEKGVTVIMASHDIEFCAEYAHICAMFFDGNIISSDAPHSFFTNNSFYTTAANRMARHKLPKAITAQDVVLACT